MEEDKKKYDTIR